MTARRARSSAETVGVIRSTRPLEAMQIPPKAHHGRKNPPSTECREPSVFPEGVCMISTCQRPSIPGDYVCDNHAAFYRFYCATCGKYLNDGAIQRTGGTLCLTCWNKTEAGKEWARKIRKSKDMHREGTR